MSDFTYHYASHQSSLNEVQVRDILSHQFNLPVVGKAE